MKKKIFCMLIAATMLLGCSNSTTTDSQDNKPAQNNDEPICLSAANAEISGQGVDNSASVMTDTLYVDDLHAIAYFGTNSAAAFSVPENIDGTFDVYLNIGKSTYAYGTTPVSITVNNKEYVTPVPIESSASDYSDIYSMGNFLMIKNIALKSGDKLTVHGKPGFEMEFGGNLVSSMSAIGDMYLYATGSDVPVGYDGGTSPKALGKADPDDPLSGLRIIWLGSSVTFGMQAGGYTMAEAIQDNHPGTECLKYAVCGTTLANDSEASYVERMKEIDPDMDIDLFIVQLSTNDATQGKILGEISTSKNMEDFDDSTIIGAMEYIIAYVTETWNCPVAFYTGTYFENELYPQMVNAALELENKWGIGVIDLWNNEEMTAIYGTEQYHSYMGDDIHPLRAGYVEWWTPEFESYLTEYMGSTNK